METGTGIPKDTRDRCDKGKFRFGEILKKKIYIMFKIFLVDPKRKYITILLKRICMY